MPRQHMSLLLYFRHASSTSQKATIQHLQAGLAAVLTEMPQFAGVLRHKKGPRNELELVLNPECGVLFRICDASDQADYDSLLNGMTQGSLVADEKLAVPAADLQTENDGTRAFAVQATSVKGGLLLATSTHHSLGDAKATEVLLKSWARHSAERSHGRSTTIEMAHEDATARWRLSYGPKDVPMESFVENCGLKGLYQAPQLAESTLPSTWTISPDAIQELTESVKTSGVQVSKSDLICSLIARHMYRARRQHETSTLWPESILLYVTLDMRSRLEPPLAKNYQGNASVGIAVTVDLATLCDGPNATALSTTAASIKTAIDNFDTTALRSRLGFYKAQPFFGSVMPNFEYYPGPNALITDTSSLGFYSLNWGPTLQTMDYFRVVGQTLAAGECAVYPKKKDGTIDFQMRHDPRVLETMKEDKEFSNFCRLVGYY